MGIFITLENMKSLNCKLASVWRTGAFSEQEFIFLICTRTSDVAYNIKNMSIVIAVKGISYVPNMKQSMLQKT